MKKGLQQLKQKAHTYSFRLRSDFFHHLLVITGVILFWRGLWGLLDVYLFPEDPALSYIIGLIIGVIMLYFPDDDIKELI